MSNAARTGDIRTNSMSMLSGLVSNFSPIGGMENFANFLAPTILDPIVNIASNKNWDNSPIQPENLPFGAQKPNSQLYWNSTSGTMKKAAEIINSLSGGDEHFSGIVDVSPNILEYMTNYMLGGAGMFVLRGGDFFTQAAPDILAGNEWDMGQIPFLRKVVSGPTNRTIAERYANNVTHIANVQKAYEEAMKAGDTDTAIQYTKDYARELSAAPAITDLQRRRARINETINKIRDSQGVPEEYKDSAIRVLRKQSQDIVNQSNKVYHDLVDK
jgi:hypothetical protein